MADDFSIYPGGRIVKDIALVDVYYQQPVPVANMTRVDALMSPTLTSGSLFISSFPQGINLFNKELGAVVAYDVATSSVSRFTTIIDTNLRRVGIAISGAVVAGRS